MPHSQNPFIVPATFACLTRHIERALETQQSAMGDDSALGLAMESLRELADCYAAVVAEPITLDAAIRLVADIISPMRPKLSISVHVSPAAEQIPLNELLVFGLAALLSGLADVSGLRLHPLRLHVDLDCVAEGDSLPKVELRVHELGAIDHKLPAMVSANDSYNNACAALALHGGIIRLSERCSETRYWQIIGPSHPVTAGLAGAASSRANVVATLAARQKRLREIQTIRSQVDLLRRTAPKKPEQCLRILDNLRPVQEQLHDLPLSDELQSLRLALLNKQASRIQVAIADIETRLVHYVLDAENHSEASMALHEPVILVVQEVGDERNDLELRLEDEGYRVHGVASAAAAAAACNFEMPDLCIVSSGLPNSEADAAIRSLLTLPEAVDLPIIIAVPRGDNAAIEAAYALGVSDYIGLPLHFETLRRRIHRLLNASHSAAQAKRLASVDSVTGLPNRVQFQQRLHEFAEDVGRQIRGFALMFLDLNRFKLINETMGHDVGDSVLKIVAQRLENAVRDGDIVARLGSDEFAVIARDVTEPEQVGPVADKLLEVINEPMVIGHREVYSSATIGVTLCPRDESVTTTLMGHADSALFHARHTEQPWALYDAGMGTRASSRIELEADLRRALINQQFELYFQPQVRLSDGRCIGGEALIRWQHPDRGLVSPAEFIPLAEDTGLIVEMGEWIIDEACRVAALIRRRGAGSHIQRVSINVSSRQLDTPELLGTLRAALARHRLPGTALEVEITESAVMKRGDMVLNTLNGIRDMGISIAVDDFGSGYCSFGYLKEFPIDVLKIDRSLTRDICGEDNDREIVRAILALANSLHLDVVAEGAERISEVTLLKEMGCTTVQGYYFSKPLPVEEFLLGYCTSTSGVQSVASGLPRHASVADAVTQANA